MRLAFSTSLLLGSGCTPPGNYEAPKSLYDGDNVQVGDGYFGGSGWSGTWDSGDSGDTGGDDEPDTDFSFPSISWGGSEDVIIVPDATDGFGLCWAQNGNSDGWYGESCLGDSPDGTDVAHTFASSEGTLEVVATIRDVIAGESTLFDASEADEVTFLVYDLDASSLDASSCAYGGYDISYYSDLGLDCAE